MFTVDENLHFSHIKVKLDCTVIMLEFASDTWNCRIIQEFYKFQEGLVFEWLKSCATPLNMI